MYLVAAVDLTGNETEEHVAVRLRDVEKSLEDSPYIEEAVLTLSYPGDESLVPTDDDVPEVVRDGTASDVASGGAGTLRTE